MDDKIPIPAHPGYSASRDGRIYSHLKEKWLEPKGTKSYLDVSITMDGKMTTEKVHRLIAMTFIPNDDPTKRLVNHKDGNKKNNHVNNLEWCTQKENMKHAVETGLLKNFKRREVWQIGLDGKFIRVFPSLIDASRSTGVYVNSIQSVCAGRYETAGGFRWIYDEEEEKPEEESHADWSFLTVYDKYKISKKGEIYSVKYDRLLKPYKMNGYLTVDIKKKGYFLHRLVAETYIPNPENYPVVNHLDGNKENNCMENLEWTTQKENIKHARENGLNKGNGFKIRQVSKIDGKEVLHDSIRSAVKNSGFSRLHIEKICEGEKIERIKADGKIYDYDWSYV